MHTAKTDGLIWRRANGKEIPLSKNFLTWEADLIKHGKQPDMSPAELATYFAWLLYGKNSDIYSTSQQRQFIFERPANKGTRSALVTSLWKELRRFTCNYDKNIFDALRDDPQNDTPGLYFDIACEVLQPTGLRLHKWDNDYSIELYTAPCGQIVVPELISKIANASKWCKQRPESKEQERRSRFSQKWIFAWNKNIYQGALLNVLKSGRIMEEKFCGGICLSSQKAGTTQETETTLCSGLRLVGNNRYTNAMPYELACICASVEKAVDLVLSGKIARCEAFGVDADISVDRLIYQLTLNFCLKNYPYYFK
ncbi:hypothetical protein [uncultured Pseudoflavonifractor sp.]|uniref:hypothetical protein n=1 Tax=uncultured Pseudoflavonifractor sp. TaxID=1221379 RepID=UPI0025E14332|nr:hypothetical protein [uncultured Pseudoflavonifractor sp.]